MTRRIATRTTILLAATALLACIGCAENSDSGSSGFTCEVGEECEFPFFGTWSGTLSSDHAEFTESGGIFSLIIASDGSVSGQGSVVVSVEEIDATADVDATNDIIRINNQPFVDGERVRVTLVSGALVGGLSLLTDYFIEIVPNPANPVGVSLHLTEAAALAGDPPIDLTNAVGEFTLVADEVFDLTSGTGKLTNKRNPAQGLPGDDDPDAELVAFADFVVGAPSHNQHLRTWLGTVFTFIVDDQLEHGVLGRRSQGKERGLFEGCPAVGQCYSGP